MYNNNNLLIMKGKLLFLCMFLLGVGTMVAQNPIIKKKSGRVWLEPYEEDENEN